MAAPYLASSHNTGAASVFAASYSGTEALVPRANIKEYETEIVATNEKQIDFPVRVL